MSIHLINPTSQRPLRIQGDTLVDDAGARFSIINGIPRICDPDNYAESFGKQWNLFRQTQIDTEDVTFSRTRFFAETGWEPDHLSGLDLLEVGSGAGRFTRVVLQYTAANIYSVDFSSSVDANLRNNGELAGGRLHLFQSSIYELPFPDGSFDKVFCLGVLQHTPSFESSVHALVRKAKRGGEIVVDFYPIRGWWTKLNSKYLLRPLTRRMSHAQLLRLIERNAGWLIAAHKSLSRVGLGALTRFLPVVDLRTVPPNLAPAHEREWVVLDTFDMFSPVYDTPQRIETVSDMFRRAGAEVTFAGFVDAPPAQAAVVRAVRR